MQNAEGWERIIYLTTKENVRGQKIGIKASVVDSLDLMANRGLGGGK